MSVISCIECDSCKRTDTRGDSWLIIEFRHSGDKRRYDICNKCARRVFEVLGIPAMIIDWGKAQ